MRSRRFVFAVLLTPLFCLAADSSFSTVQFGTDFVVSLPKNWSYLDKEIAAHMNTAAEAAGRRAGINLSQGNNEILVAANAHDSQGKTAAQLRISVRNEPSGSSQEELRELHKLPPAELKAILWPAAQESIKGVKSVPGVEAYSVRGVGVDKGTSLYCLLSSFEGKVNGSPMESDTWICPIGNKTLKFNASYLKRHKAIFQPTIQHVKNSLALAPK